MAKGCALSTGYLPRGGLPRNSVDRLTDRPDMTSAVDRGRKASTQNKKQSTWTWSYNFLVIVAPVTNIHKLKHMCHIVFKLVTYGYRNHASY